VRHFGQDGGSEGHPLFVRGWGDTWRVGTSTMALRQAGLRRRLLALLRGHAAKGGVSGHRLDDIKATGLP
jgi:hypothetical protein